MADTRTCAQCGGLFAPRREHARFCSARCRAAWNRHGMGDPAAEMSALAWSVAAMRDTAERLPRVRAWDRRRGSAVIGEAVWWVTIVDATLVRHHPDTYDAALASLPPADRRFIEEALTGLRFVRNQIGCGADIADFIRADTASTAADASYIAAWIWKRVPEPAFTSLMPHSLAWERMRYQAYQAQLAGRTMGEVFGRVAAFLDQATAATSVPDNTANAAR